MARQMAAMPPCKRKAVGKPCVTVSAATMSCMLGIAGIGLFAPTAKHLKDVLGLNVSQLSLLIAFPTLTGSLLRVPFGAMVDDNGGKKPILFLLGMAILGLVGLSCIMHHTDEQLKEMKGTVYPLLLFCGMLTGCGGAIFSVGAGQASYWSKANVQGNVLGMYGGIGNLPPGLVALGLPFALKAFGMFKTYVAWLVCLMAGTAVYFVIGQNAPYFQLKDAGLPKEEAVEVAKEKYGQELFPKGSAVESLQIAALNIKTWALVSMYFLTYGGYLAMTTWLTTFWTQLHGCEAVIAGLLTAVYSEGNCLTRAFIGGKLADKFGGERMLLISFPIVGAGALMLVCTESFSSHVAATVVMAISMGICNGSVFKLVPTYVPEALGGAAGWVGGLGAFGGFVLPPVLAQFKAAQGKVGYKNGFLVYVVLAVVGWCIVFLLKLAKDAEEAEDSSEDDDSSDETTEDSDDDSEWEDSKA
eukprot:CAMPEP_0171108366 /NCGR_PEP_ID=MMETSP0766_2-20121228/68786_1 /TAXON_ID=439317 /ORGANISM="Gambierdiscus australes, Strain CAWD 149" /LENGTH=470 /DNA_ID=CAMNT_0011569881 /DNA_START=41 /DNA_END=1453 /DNA_ORIENTATION=+